MTLDESQENDETFNDGGLTFLIDKELLEQVKPIKIEIDRTDCRNDKIVWGSILYYRVSNGSEIKSRKIMTILIGVIIDSKINVWFIYILEMVETEITRSYSKKNTQAYEDEICFYKRGFR